VLIPEPSSPELLGDSDVTLGLASSLESHLHVTSADPIILLQLIVQLTYLACQPSQDVFDVLAVAQ
jgi:hypothetical protein